MVWAVVQGTYSVLKKFSGDTIYEKWIKYMRLDLPYKKLLWCLNI